METPADRKPGRGLKRDLLLIAVLILLIRLPFLNQAVQGDDVYYLSGAQNAQIDPLHPNHYRYVFLGDRVDMRGHPHPPLNAWILALLLALTGDVHEPIYHAAYILFSAIAAVSMYALARRFSPHPLWATLLFVATPAFVINGNSLESDLPFLTFWMASVALVVTGSRWAALPLALSALAAFQAVFLTPVLWLYAWLFERRSKRAWLLALAPPLALAGWQLFERLSTGAMPAAVLSGHFSRYGFQALENKLRNALMLSIHLGWIVFPPLLAGAVWIAWRKRGRETGFLAGWIAIFFAGSLMVFFAGSARYLLPVVAPVALLASRLRPRWLALGFAVYLPLSLALAKVNYDHWNGYRAFAAGIREHVRTRRTWINAEWGLRYYLESNGGLALEKGQPVRPGDLVVTSELAYPVEFTTGGGALAPVASAVIAPSLPLRLIGLDSRSGYSTHSNGFLPFDVSAGPADRVRAELVVAREPALSYLPINAPEAANQIVTGLYPVEDNRWRWTAGNAVLLLKSPRAATPLQATFAIPDAAPARAITLLMDGRPVAWQSYTKPGVYTLKSGPVLPPNKTATLTVAVDRTFSVPGDHRVLGVILTGAGFLANGP
jgi:hypothetical protein